MHPRRKKHDLWNFDHRGHDQFGKYRSFPPLWKGETIFIIAGGTSVLRQDLSLLKGRRVIVVNSSYETYPDADALYFGDSRWYDLHREKEGFKKFAGLIVTTSQAASGARLIKGKRITPGPSTGLAVESYALAGVRTSLQAAMNLGFHYGGFALPEVTRKRMVLLGADAGRAADGRSHHHAAHPWKNKPENRTWDIQNAQFQTIVAPLAKFGVEVINTSDITRIPWWPIRPLEQAVADEQSLSGVEAG